MKKFNLIYEKPNLYLLFIEITYQLLKQESYLGFIIPNSWLGMDSAKLVREFLLSNTSIISLIGLQGESFPNVSVETVILTYKRSKPLNHEVAVLNIDDPLIITAAFQKTQQDAWKQNRNYIIDILSNTEDLNVLHKLKNNSINLSDLFDVRVGMQAYEKGKGNPQQTEEDVKNHVFDYSYKFDDNTYPYLNGLDVG